MIRVTVLAALVITTVFAFPQKRIEYREVNVPGTLEAILLANPRPLARHELGSLTPPDRVTIFAVVASDPVSKRAAKGLEVQLEGDDIWNGNRHCKDSVFIDEDGLADLNRRITGFVEYVDWAMSHEESLKSESPSITFAANTPGGKEKTGVYYVPVVFGYYWTGTRFGVSVASPHSQPISGPHRTCQFNLPNANIAEVQRLIVDGRRWLQNYDEAPAASASVDPK